MNILYLPTLISLLAFIMLGAYVFLKNRGQRLNLFFALGMGSLTLMEFGNLMALIHIGAQATIFWKRLSLVGECLVPLAWLVFTMSLVSRKSLYQLKKWKAAFIGVGLASVFFAASVPFDVFAIQGKSSAVLTLGGIGKGFYIFFLLSAVVIVANLERIIRQSKGADRIRIKSFVLGLGGLFAFLIFLTSQNLLFSRINLKMIPVTSSFLVICTGIIAFALVRNKLMDVNLYMSRFIIYNSLTLIVVGGYLIFIGLVSQMLRSFNIIPGYPLEILFLSVALLLFFSVFLSDRVRWQAKTFINRHFYRGRYDYRDEWLQFAGRLSLKLDIDELAATIVNMLKDSVGVNDVSLWLYEETAGFFRPLGPSLFVGKACIHLDHKLRSRLMEQNIPFAFDRPWARDFVLKNREILERVQPALFVPLVSGTEMVGLILIGKKRTGEEFIGEDIDLLRSVAALITSAIMNARLSRELIKAKEMEVFHRFSSFFMHDLKNLISSLSLVLKNAEEHMGNPQFQKDTLDIIERSVKKMETIIARLSSKTVPEQPDFQETDINEVVSDVVGRMGKNGHNNKTVEVDLRDLPRALVDREQLEKVVGNLFFNAIEATDNDGFIRIQTEAHDGEMILTISDNGHGMSPEFMENDLFRPFTSTKQKGFGIGLYQCKTIVEAHQGKIEVESNEGVGSIFRVIIPFQRESKERRGNTENVR